MPTKTDPLLHKLAKGSPIPILLVMLWSLSGCGGSFGGGDAPLVGDLGKGEAAYEKAHYRDAIQYLERFQETQPGSRFMDKALYLLGKSHQGIREFLLAEDSFSQLLSDYPTSAWAEDGSFELAMSAYGRSKGYQWDPEGTEAAIRAFRQYLLRYPAGKYVEESEKGLHELEGRLAMKACKNGEQYLKLQRYKAAKYYFEKGMGFRDDVEAVPHCYVGLAEALEELGDNQGALDAFKGLEEWLAEHGDTVLESGRVAELLDKAQRGIRRLEGAAQSSSSMPLTGGNEQ